jgi:hypothetical protein
MVTYCTAMQMYRKRELCEVLNEKRCQYLRVPDYMEYCIEIFFKIYNGTGNGGIILPSIMQNILFISDPVPIRTSLIMKTGKNFQNKYRYIQLLYVLIIVEYQHLLAVFIIPVNYSRMITHNKFLQKMHVRQHCTNTVNHL